MPTVNQNSPTPSLLKSPIIIFFIISMACSASYFIGSYTSNSTPSSHPRYQHHCLHLNFSTLNDNASLPLHFQPRHILLLPQDHSHGLQTFKSCPSNFTNYCPCQDPSMEKQFVSKIYFHRERHCPMSRLRCLVPRPAGYRRPFPWPKSRDFAWFNNVPFSKLTVSKKGQNWVRLQGDRLVFPGGGTSFPKGAKEYVNDISRVVPLKSGSIRTVLDVGCGVASFGAALMNFDILTMSVAPRDIHEAQVQFALERGLPAMLGILSTYRLPYPSRSFDMVHCSRCLVPWTAYGGLYLMEIDRVLRPGGYWVLSGPPIRWKVFYKGWQRPARDLEEEQINLESIARKLCWEKIAERGPLAFWRKPSDHIHSIKKSKVPKSAPFCSEADPDYAWYKKMDPCITPLPMATDALLPKWPRRLNSAPSEARMQKIKGMLKNFDEDNRLWKRRVSNYMSILKSFSAVMYRNIMDMNAGMGGFAAALSTHPVWVMNVVPFDVEHDTLGIIYDRGLIGTYMNWCEAFSTYPRTYDLIHAHGLFSFYSDKCDAVDILFEMHRILRPEGAVIIRDHVDVITRLKDITDRMKLNGRILNSEDGPFHPQKILLVDNSA